MRLSVLDQSPIRSGGTATDAIRETLTLAETSDRLGYARYWLAEHHGLGVGSASPEILIEAVASRTSNIRVGSGGVMLPHYSPLKVAENFRMLEALHPGRIDLGVGRAFGGDALTAQALGTDVHRQVADAYPEQIMDLYGYLSDSLPEDHPYHGVKAVPGGDTMPELWVLGSSDAGATYAADAGWSFCFAHFINPIGGLDAMRNYRRRFEASPFLPAPRGMIAISATVANTSEEAERLCWSRWYLRVVGQRGRRTGVPSPEEAMAFDYTPAEREYIDFMRDNSIHGDPATVKARITALAAEYEVDEVMVVTITHDFAARVRSYELLAEAFG